MTHNFTYLALNLSLTANNHIIHLHFNAYLSNSKQISVFLHQLMSPEILDSSFFLTSPISLPLASPIDHTTKINDNGPFLTIFSAAP